MKNLKTLSFILGACVSFYACTDLDEELVDSFTESYSEANPAAPFIAAAGGGGGGDALGGAYSKLRDGSAGHFGIFSAQTLPSDEAWIATKGGDWYDGGILIDLHKHNFPANNGILNNTWNQQYGGINAVNDALAGADADGKKQLRTVRAFFYYRLLDMFGRVKIIKASGEDAPQSSRQEVFDFVESELLDVLGLTRAQVLAGDAPTEFGPANNAYRVNHFGAMGLLSKLYLNAEVYTDTAMWDEAAAAANYVIENGGQYKLATASYSGNTGSARTMDYSVTNLGRLNSNEVDRAEGNIYTYDNLEGYAAIFAANNEGNPEFIWSIEYDEVTAGGMNFAQMTLHYGSQFTWNLQDQPWNGYATLSDFYNSYDDPNDKRKESNHVQGKQLTFNGGPVRDYAKEPQDQDTWLEFTASNEGGIYPNGLRQAGARLGKFSFKQFGRPDMDNDYPIIRLGELYLIRAEATARAAGNWDLALSDVNIIRGRAGASQLSSMSADAFLAERGREMFQESSRRTDQIRFGKYFAGTDQGKGSTASPEYKEIFPIPLDAINASNGSLTQNPQY
ncbi:MAG: RagB/SusD family nutrient uptake outer membrane protein [Flavobacteriaceae bacterium]